MLSIKLHKIETNPNPYVITFIPLMYQLFYFLKPGLTEMVFVCGVAEYSFWMILVLTYCNVSQCPILSNQIHSMLGSIAIIIKIILNFLSSVILRVFYN